ncbi:hypothetical protein BGZ47_010839 [Haplosporangium gracile]|nr:hypothetical protein BGZ47_010839 [Haplosporangium gracile]
MLQGHVCAMPALGPQAGTAATVVALATAGDTTGLMNKPALSDESSVRRRRASVLDKRDDSDYCVYFYEEREYKDQTGFTCGELGPGESRGTPSAYWDIRSLKAPEWLKVTLYDEPYYKGKSVVYHGDQKVITRFMARSAKYKNTN